MEFLARHYEDIFFCLCDWILIPPITQEGNVLGINQRGCRLLDANEYTST